MKEPANLELSIALPLGVIANQLKRIEAEMRFLSMKAAACRAEREGGELAAKLSGGLEKINEALDLIRGVVADMEAGIQPRPSDKSVRERVRRRPAADQDD